MMATKHAEESPFEPVRLNGQTRVEEVDIDDAFAEQADPSFEISCTGADLDVNGLIRRFNRGDIYFPEFQRRYVWNRKQASRLVESVLVGLPIPSLFLYRDREDNRLLVIDGLQRLTTLAAFHNGHWPETSSVFRLTGLSERSSYHRRTYEELDDNSKRRFDDAIIHVLFISEDNPDDRRNTALRVFERLNTGGTPLQAQEMRNALFGGAFKNHLVELNENDDWRTVFGQLHKRAKDQELILRFLALHNGDENYGSSMKVFLNDFMSKHKNASEEELQEFTRQFMDTLGRVIDALGTQPFRTAAGGLSVPYYDAFMVAIAENPNASSKEIVEAYKSMQVDEEFHDLVRSATTDHRRITRRIEKVRDALHVAQ